MKSLRLHGAFRIYLAVAGCVILFAALAFSMLWFQQKIVDAAVETHGVITPQSQAQMRAVRNLDLLRYYGSLALKSADPLLRRTAILHATLSASHPSTQVDQATRLLMDEAISHIQAIRTGECTPEQWAKMDARLAERADTLVIATSDRVLQQAGSIKGLATDVRNMALAQSILFIASIAFVVVWGVALQSRARAKNQYFNELSHDLRQRVHAMELFFAREVHGLKADFLSSDNGRIHVMVKDLQRYLDNFLDVARMDAVVVRPTMSRFGLVGLFQQLALQLEAMAEQRGVNLNFRHTRISIVSDEQWLRRILENLIVNAIKFSRGKILVAARRRGKNVQILVIDNGEGMADVHGQPKRSPEISRLDHGHGLGLSMVKRTAEVLGGCVVVRSMVGHGTTVRVDLPISE